MEDLKSVTRYVTWSLHAKNRDSLRSMFMNVAQSHEIAVGAGGAKKEKAAAATGSPSGGQSKQDQLLELLESSIFTRRLTPITEEMVSSLVACVYGGIREYLTQAIELKFNCFFLMPFVDEFPAILRTEIEGAYDQQLEDVFDVAAVKKQLTVQKNRLESEVASVQRLRSKFEHIYSTLQARYQPRTTPAAQASLEKKFQKAGVSETGPTRLPFAANNMPR